MQKRLSTKAIVIGLILCCAIGIGGTSVSWMGTTYTIPSTGETDWSGPTKVDGFLTSVASNALSKAGGNFTLTADVNFGASFGLLAPYFSARTNAATTGFIRMDNGGSISWRNAANSANLPLSVNSSNELTFNGFTILNSSGLLPVASGGTGLASYSVGDTLYASGATTLSKLAIGSSGLVMVSNTSAPLWQKITDAQVQDSAAISRAKLASGSADHVVINSAAGAVSSEATLAVSRGGTNTASYTTGDLLYASGATTLTKLGIGSTGQQLTVSGGVPSWGSAAGTISVATKTSNYTIQNTDDLILGNSTGGSLLLTLPAASSNGGKVFNVKKSDSSRFCFGIIRAGTDSIRHVSSKTQIDLCTPDEQFSLVSDGSSTWQVLEHKIPSYWAQNSDFSLQNLGTPGSSVFLVKREGDSLLVSYKIIDASGAAGSGGIVSPGYWTIDSAKSLGANNQVWGYGMSTTGAAATLATGGFYAIYDVGVTTRVTISDTHAGDGDSTVVSDVNSNTFLNANAQISGTYKIPISGWEP